MLLTLLMLTSKPGLEQFTEARAKTMAKIAKRAILPIGVLYFRVEMNLD